MTFVIIGLLLRIVFSLEFWTTDIRFNSSRLVFILNSLCKEVVFGFVVGWEVVGIVLWVGCCVGGLVGSEVAGIVIWVGCFVGGFVGWEVVSVVFGVGGFVGLEVAGIVFGGFGSTIVVGWVVSIDDEVSVFGESLSLWSFLSFFF